MFRAGAVALGLLLACGSAAAQLRLPHADTQRDVEIGAELRAAIVLQHNACERDGDLSTYLAEVAAGEFANQGEPLTSILIAKMHRISLGASCDPSDVGQANLRRQINDAVQALRKVAVMGTDGVPCITSLSIPSGDWDVVVRELTRLLYMDREIRRNLTGGVAEGTGVLEQPTLDFMWQAGLLAASGPLGNASSTMLAACSPHAGDADGLPLERVERESGGRTTARDVGAALLFLFFWWAAGILTVGAAALGAPTLGIGPALGFWGLMDAVSGPLGMPETENHRLMIETSRYLANRAIIERVLQTHPGHPDLESFREDQREVERWLLQRLHEIANRDFDEYNSRPYTRYSIEAVSNLFDFAVEPGRETTDAEIRLRTAAHIVLDLSHARFAIGSNGGRRVVNWRRRVSSDPLVTSDKAADVLTMQRWLFNYQRAADHLVARSLVLGGQTRLAGDLPLNEIGILVNPAVSGYRLPPPVTRLTADRSAHMMQRVLLGNGDEDETGIEIHSRTPAFTISAGGVPTDPALAFLGLFTSGDDPGIAVPTTLIPTGWGVVIDDLIRFDGSRGRVGDERSGNLCVYRGFACGLWPHRPDWIAGCFSPPWNTGIPDGIFMLNTEGCPGPGENGPGPPLAGPHFFLAVRAADTPHGDRWGVFEAFSASNQDAGPAGTAARAAEFATFRTSRDRELRNLDSFVLAPHNESQAYRLFTGERVEFDIRSGYVGGGPITPDAGTAVILGVDGQSPLPDGTTGAFVQPRRSGSFGISGGNGRLTISADTGPRVDIDVTDPEKPSRTVREP